jgi:hypothetical protein
MGPYVIWNEPYQGDAKVHNGAFYGITRNHIISIYGRLACPLPFPTHACNNHGTCNWHFLYGFFLFQNTLPKHMGVGILQLHLVICRIWLGHYCDSNLEMSSPFSHQCMRVFVPLLSQNETAPTSAPSRMDGKWSGISFLLAPSSPVNHGG